MIERPATFRSCLVVGAGLSGLVAARRLQDSGLKVIVLEAEVSVGGRLATASYAKGGPIFDTGAQFFTVRDPQFGKLVDTWLSAGIIDEWSRGFATADGSYYADGHPRYRASRGMADIAGHLASGLDVQLNARVSSLALENERWVVTLESGQSYSAAGLLLTPPVPQSLALLANSDIPLPKADREALAQVTYELCLSLQVTLDSSSAIPEPGGMWPVGEPLAWMADNHRKGISPTAGAVTLHAGPEFSLEHWDNPDEIVAEEMLAAAGRWLGGRVMDTNIRRWRYSKPLWTFPRPFLAISWSAPLVFAGDAFAGPRVEGAVLSGLAAAHWLLNQT